MPCNCDHMEPNERERANRRAAKILVWAKTKLGKSVPDYAKRAADDAYGIGGDRATAELCALFGQMNRRRLEEMLKENAFEVVGRDAIAWWQEHQESDAAKAVPDIEVELGLNVNDKRGGRKLR